jgi:diaminohydroxyphosphoribosylaminopyrimidine deaminase/5-amino-6-(5-phosphoribosylamino)uracil reductase
MSAADQLDLRWLDAAARLAMPHLGTTAENPTVGALVIDPAGQAILGCAVTARGGRPHAETQALDQAGEAARGATLYSTLEPGPHWGRTPPSVDAVIRKGIRRVVVGMADPDPRIGGNGLKRLAESGIEVRLVDHPASRRLNEAHVARIQHGRPFVTAILAISADERVRTLAGKPVQPGPRAQAWLEMQRVLSGAIMVHSAMAERDNPDLLVRLDGLQRRTPLRVLLAGSRNVDRRLTLIGGISGYPVLVLASHELELVVPPSIEVVRIPGERTRPDLSAALAELHKRHVTRLLVEAEPTFLTRLLEVHLVDRLELIRTAAELGADALPALPEGSLSDLLLAGGLAETAQRTIGPDTIVTYERF